MMDRWTMHIDLNLAHLPLMLPMPDTQWGIANIRIEFPLLFNITSKCGYRGRMFLLYLEALLGKDRPMPLDLPVNGNDGIKDI